MVKITKKAKHVGDTDLPSARLSESEQAALIEAANPILKTLKVRPPRLSRAVRKAVLDLDESALDNIPRPMEARGNRDFKTSGRKNSMRELVAYRRLNVRALIVRGYADVEIADRLGLPITLVQTDVAETNKQLKAELNEFDLPLFVAKSLSFYDDARKIAIDVGASAVDTETRLSAVRTATQIESEKQRYLERLGLFKHLNPMGSFPRTSERDDGADFDKFLRAFPQLPAPEAA